MVFDGISTIMGAAFVAKPRGNLIIRMTSLILSPYCSAGGIRSVCRTYITLRLINYDKSNGDYRPGPETDR